MWFTVGNSLEGSSSSNISHHKSDHHDGFVNSLLVMVAAPCKPTLINPHPLSLKKKKKKIKVPMYLPWPELTQALKCMSVQWWRVQLWWDNSFKEMISFWLLWLKLLVGSGMRWHLSVCLFVRRSNSEISRWIIYRIQTVMTHTQKKKIAGAEKWWGGEVWFPSAELFGRCHGIWRFEACLFCLGTLPFVRPDCGWI